MNRLARSALVVLSLVWIAGCGNDGRSSVTGKVTLDGVPVEFGAISFTPEAGTQSPSAGGDIKNGEYKVTADKGPMPGTFTVKLQWPRKTGKILPAASPAPPGSTYEVTVEAFPAKYNKDSELKVIITPGANTHNFELQSK